MYVLKRLGVERRVLSCDAVTKEDVDCMKDDWLTDNVRFLLPGSSLFGTSRLTFSYSGHCVLGRVKIPSSAHLHSPFTETDLIAYTEKIPRTRHPPQIPRLPRNPPPPLHDLYAHANPGPNHPPRRPTPLQKHNPHLPPHQRLHQPTSCRRRLPLVTPARQPHRPRGLPLRLPLALQRPPRPPRQPQALPTPGPPAAATVYRLGDGHVSAAGERQRLRRVCVSEHAVLAGAEVAEAGGGREGRDGDEGGHGGCGKGEEGHAEVGRGV